LALRKCGKQANGKWQLAANGNWQLANGENQTRLTTAKPIRIAWDESRKSFRSWDEGEGWPGFDKRVIW
jgi:hypothetical protein